MRAAPVVRIASSRRIVASALLLAAIAVGLVTAQRLARLGEAPNPARPYVEALFVALGLGILAGIIAGPAGIRSSSEPLGRWPGNRGARLVAVIVSVASFAATWRLQRLALVPLWSLAVWAVGVAALPWFFRGVEPPRRPRGAGLPHPALIVAFAGLLAMGAAARFAGLDRVQAVRSGDENTVTMDGIGTVSGLDVSDPFGTGVQSCSHLAMMPAGAGYLLTRDPIAGSRLPYALVGTLSLAAAAGLTATIAGPYAALGALALLALAPLHVFWSRTSDLVIFDSLLAGCFVWALLRAWRSGSPRAACVAGLVAGGAVYSYSGARILPVMLVLSVGPVLWSHRGRRLSMAAALLAGFVICAAPGARFAAERFDEWNGRFNSASILAEGWFRREAQELGSAANVLTNQARLGTIGLLSAPSTIHFAGHPIVGPPILPALGIAGFGWLLGRRRFAAAWLTGLVVAGNLAGTALTLPTPGSSRPSSLVPILAVLGGVAVAALVSSWPERPLHGVRFRPIVACVLVGVLVVWALPGYPLDAEGHAEAGGRHAAFVQSAAALIDTPFGRHRRVFLHGFPHVTSGFSSWEYFLPGTEVIDVPPEARAAPDQAGFPPGLHVVSPEYLRESGAWLERLGVSRRVRLAHPSIPTEDAGLFFVVPGDSLVDCRPYARPWDPTGGGDEVGDEALREESVTVADRRAAIGHTPFDTGSATDLFDGDPGSLVRSVPAHSAIVELTFDRPRLLRGIDVTTGTMDVVCLIVDVGLASGQSRTVWKSFRHLPPDPTVSLDFPDPLAPMASIRATIPCPSPVACHVHIREIALR